MDWEWRLPSPTAHPAPYSRLTSRLERPLIPTRQTTLLDTTRPGAGALSAMGTIMLVISTLFLVNPAGNGGPNTFMFAVGAFPGGYMLWAGSRRRKVWFDHDSNTLFERRMLFGLRAERTVAGAEMPGVTVAQIETPIKQKLWQQMLSAKIPGAPGTMATLYQVSLGGIVPPMVIGAWKDEAEARKRAEAVAKAGGWKVI